jgi:glycosyltransferase involved in cell wall biosynthesis
VDRISVGVDGYNLALPNGTGVATYAFTLARLLADAGHATTGVFGIDAGRDPDLVATRFFDRFGHVPQTTPVQRRRFSRRIGRAALLPFRTARAVALPPGHRVETAPFAERLPPFERVVTSPDLFALAHRHFRVYGRLLPLRVDDPPQVMHWTYPVPVELVGAANIYTLHDLVPLRLPYTTLDAKRDYRALLAACARSAAHLCTVSEASRADIVSLLGVAEDAVTNCYQASPAGLAVTTSADEDAAAIENIFGLRRQNYFLYFGAIEPKKNIGRLLEAYLSTGSAHPLVMVGGRGWRSEEELRLLPEGEGDEPAIGHDLRHRVIRLDHLSRALLLKLVRSARAVLFPSIAEGFGLPVLEAMQLGTPVLTSNTSALPEVAGDAALLVDPYDVGAIAADIRALDGDDALRARLAAAGPVRSRLFAPDRYLDRIEAMYCRVLADRH